MAPDTMEGKRLKGDSSDGVYLCLDGQLRLIANSKVYESLFGKSSSETVYQGLINHYPKGPSLDLVTSLVKSSDGTIYMIDDRKKRWITTVPTLNKYFPGGNVTPIGDVTTLLPDGKEISAT